MSTAFWGGWEDILDGLVQLWSIVVNMDSTVRFPGISGSGFVKNKIVHKGELRCNNIVVVDRNKSRTARSDMVGKF